MSSDWSYVEAQAAERRTRLLAEADHHRMFSRRRGRQPPRWWRLRHPIQLLNRLRFEPDPDRTQPVKYIVFYGSTDDVAVKAPMDFPDS
jgi:diadenosine tetraphosphatase ApaH/serine/threonine PP2A family protein phosphatase